ncbi:MAG: GNAT family N-acetyltransferase [Nitrospirota bacterium]
MERWDSLVRTSINGTLFHMRRFLQYHDDKFTEYERWLVALDGDAPYAQIVLTVCREGDVLVARSPYGASYGGFVFQQLPTYRAGQSLVSAFYLWLEEHGIQVCILQQPISCCSAYNLDTFIFNLMEKDFRIVKRDVSSVVRLQAGLPVVSSRARNMVRKAEKNGLKVVRNAELDLFWHVVEKTFEKHGANPTHTKTELAGLIKRFPDRIRLSVAIIDTIPVSGICEFVINKCVNSSFYLCQDPAYQRFQGLSMLVLNALGQSEKDGYLYYDFGTSTANMQAGPNIFCFKESFGAEGYFRDTLQWRYGI